METRRRGHFRLQVNGGTASGRAYHTTVEASGDPGYAATAVMIGRGAGRAAACRRLTSAAMSLALTPAARVMVPLATS